MKFQIVGINIANDINANAGMRKRIPVNVVFMELLKNQNLLRDWQVRTPIRTCPYRFKTID
jgi:hypothetical protein